MMRRGKLIYRGQRHQWAARTMLARQPLVARLTKHQRLAHELGSPAFPSPAAPIPTRTSLLPEQTIDSQEQSFLPSPGLVFLPPLNMQPQDEQPPATPIRRGDLDGRPSQPSPSHHQPATLLPTIDDMQPDEAASTFIQTPVRSDAETITHTRNQNQELVNAEMLQKQPTTGTTVYEEQQQRPEQQRTTSQQALSIESETEAKVLEEQHTEASVEQESIPAPEQGQSTTLQAVKQPTEIIKPRRPRRSIEELPTQPGRGSNPPSQPRKEAQSMTHEQSQNPATINPDDLFAPGNTDRSPQAWLARLIGKSAPGSVSEGVETEAGVSNHSPSHPVKRDEGQQPEADMGRFLERDGVQVEPGAGHGRTGGPLRVALRPLPGIMRGWENEGHPQGASLPFYPAPVPTAPGVVSNEPDRVSFLAGDVQVPSTTGAAVQRTPTPFSMRARRLLQPLVGIDPASVRVHRDERAARLTAAYQADALAVGDDVEIAPGHQDETPETLGLLAHELTHVARQREPNFVPPVLRVAPATKTVPSAAVQPRMFRQPTAPASTSAPATPALFAAPANQPIFAAPALSAPSPSATADEEGLALQVERQVRQIAHHNNAGVPSQVQQPGTFSLIEAEIVAPPPAHRAANDPWGGLPAPWEPLPDWLASPPNTTETGMSASVAPVIPSPSQPSTMADRNIVGPPLAGGLESDAGGLGSGAGRLGSGSGANVQRAGNERSVGMRVEAAEMSSSAPGGESAALEPDLDELARQVYARLKRRLDVERQRFS